MRSGKLAATYGANLHSRVPEYVVATAGVPKSQLTQNPRSVDAVIVFAKFVPPASFHLTVARGPASYAVQDAPDIYRNAERTLAVASYTQKVRPHVFDKYPTSFASPPATKLSIP